MWLHPAVWLCVPLNVGQEAAARSRRSRRALPAAGGTDGQLRSCEGARHGAAGSRGASQHRAPTHAPTTAHCTLLLARAEKGMAVEDTTFLNSIQLCGGCVIRNNTTALPHP